MKKLVLSLFVFFLFSVIAHAQSPQSQETDSSRMGRCPMMGMGMMMPRVVANLPDGSILVQSGQILIKYDQNLNMVKQVTVPADTASMKQLQKMCPGTPPPQGKQQPKNRTLLLLKTTLNSF